MARYLILPAPLKEKKMTLRTYFLILALAAALVLLLAFVAGSVWTDLGHKLAHEIAVGGPKRW